MGVASGLSYILYLLVRRFWRWRQVRREHAAKVPADIVRLLEKLRKDSPIPTFRDVARVEKIPKTIGFFLGAFTSPPTPIETDLLSRWDIVVLDLLKPGVYQAARMSEAMQVVGRLDIATFITPDSRKSNDRPAALLEKIHSIVCAKLRDPVGLPSPVTGILIAGWRGHLSSELTCELIIHLKALGLQVYLEADEAEFLTNHECNRIGLEFVKGLICRNGTILRNGDRRNYYQMANMRRSQRALAKHMSLGGVLFAMWETIDDDVQLAHSVAKRSSNWCRFNTALSWVGPQSALYDAGIATEKSLVGEPVGALMWLKSNESMVVHDTWRQNGRIVERPSVESSAYGGLEDLVPDLASKLRLQPSIRRDSVAEAGLMLDASFDWSQLNEITDRDPFSTASDGSDYTGLGCFQIGLDASAKDFQELVKGQIQLRELGMLERLQNKQMLVFFDKLKRLRERQGLREETPDVFNAITELLTLLQLNRGEEDDLLRVYVGLHSGFHRGTHQQYWGLYETNHDNRQLDIYLSGKCRDRSSALLHTFLSSRGLTRFQCLTAETNLGELNGEFPGGWQLPPRLVQDVEELSSNELLRLIQTLSFSRCEHSTIFSARVQALCRHQLLDVPSLAQLRSLNTSGYIGGEVSAQRVVESRIEWYRNQGCWIPDPAAAVALFHEVDRRLPELLMQQRSDVIERLEKVLFEIINESEIDASADMFALSVFCAFRKLAVDEVYLEILDRNPLPNRHSDQAACFAEMFATGSQCETYFDLKAKALGRILAAKYQSYYMVKQPPYSPDRTTELPTAYASKQVDEDPEARRQSLPLYYKATFLGIFAVPALCDIMLLTTIGRGLYLSTYMGTDVKRLATAGLFSGLLVTGGIGTWIGQGGSYYLHAMAFPAMSMFVLTRFTAGIAVIIGVGMPVFLIVGGIIGWYAAVCTSHALTFRVLLTIWDDSFSSFSTLLLSARISFFSRLWPFTNFPDSSSNLDA